MLSPSASLAAGAQVRVEDSVAVVGVRVTAEITGTLLLMVTVLEDIAVPLALPSLGVAAQTTASDLLKYVPVSVDVVAATSDPFTAQV